MGGVPGLRGGWDGYGDKFGRMHPRRRKWLVTGLTYSQFDYYRFH